MNKRLNRRMNDKSMWMKLALPAMFCVTAFMLYPIVYSIVLSFYSHKGIKSTYVGIGNFQKLIGDKIFWKAMKNNLIFLVIQVPVMLFLGLFFAYLLQTKDLKFKGFFRMALFLPCITSLVAYSIVFRTMFQLDGIINTFLAHIGLISEPIPWLTNKFWSRALVIIALCWRWTGYNTMYYIAGMQNISSDVLDAAKIDGCNKFQEFFHIVVPQLKQVIIFTSITSTIGTLQLFDEVVNLTKGGPANATLTVSYYIYKTSFESSNNFGYSSAMSWAVVLFIAALSLLQLKYTKED